MPGTQPNTDALAKIVRQHAHTSRLMGVNFVPAYRTSADDPADAVQSISAPAFDRAEVKPEDAPTRSERDEPPPSPARAASDDKSQRALDALRDRYIKAAPHAPFIKSFTNIVFGEGDPHAKLCFVGEAPGEEEDKTGRPFVGRAGQLLEKMIGAMGLTRADVYICNVLKVRPPNNATPTPEEAAASEPYLMEQLDIIGPEVIVTLGKSASQCLLKSTDSMGSMRARWHTTRLPTGRTIAVMPTFHPAYLLRSYTEENRKKVWSDLKMVLERLASTRREA